MTKREKGLINALAKILYSMHGYVCEHGFDFSESIHPQEKSMWNLAKASKDFWEMAGSKK